MTTISTKRHPRKFYLSIATVSIFSFSSAYLLVYLTFLQQNNGKLHANEWLMTFVIISLIIIPFHFIFTYFTKSPNVTIKGSQIIFGNKETYSLKEIETITLSAKMPFSQAYNFLLEGMAIQFKNGSKKILYDSMYANLWEIKSFLFQVVEQQQAYQAFEVNQYKSIDLYLTEIQVFKGNQFTSFRGLTLWIVIFFSFFLIVITYQHASTETILALIIIVTFFFLFFSWMMNYIIITNDYLVIKNHNIWFWQNVFALEDIKEVVFETSAKYPYSIRVITKDFKSKLYKSSTLRNNTWLQLKEQLEKKGIAVRNECIPV